MSTKKKDKHSFVCRFTALEQNNRDIIVKYARKGKHIQLSCSLFDYKLNDHRWLSQLFVYLFKKTSRDYHKIKCYDMKKQENQKNFFLSISDEKMFYFKIK